MENDENVCAFCGKLFNRKAPNQKTCSDDCSRELKLRTQRIYQRANPKKYQKTEYAYIKGLKHKDNLAKAVAEYGPAGLELVQEFCNVLHKATIIAKNNSRKVDHNVIGAIMWEFRKNNVGCME